MENLEVMEKSWKLTWSGKVREIYRKMGATKTGMHFLLI